MKNSFVRIALPTWIMTGLLYAGWKTYQEFTGCYFAASLLVALWELNEKHKS